MPETEKQEKQETSNKIEECHDLSNLRYKTLLENGKKNPFPTHKSADASKIEAILENEMNMKKNQPWSRLDRIEKIEKLSQYAIRYCQENNLSAAELSTMKTYLTAAINRNRLLKVKDVKYNKETGKIDSVPYLQFNTTTRKFTLKRSDKRTSTLSSLGTGTNTTRKKRDSKGKNGSNDDN